MRKRWSQLGPKAQRVTAKLACLASIAEEHAYVRTSIRLNRP